jgi:nucleotide-binding universal stress UspA family protein
VAKVLLVCGAPAQETNALVRLPTAAVLAACRQDFADRCRLLFSGYPALKELPQVLATAGGLLVEAVKTARDQGADILIMDSEDAEATCPNQLPGQAGGIALALSATTSCPVCVVPSKLSLRAGPFEKVLVTVDISSDPAPLRGLLNYAARLAVREGAELHVLHTLPHKTGEPAPGCDQAVRAEEDARERLASLCRGLPGADRIVFVVSEGLAGVEILQTARERRADLLIVDRRDNGAGDNLARVLEGVRCPLLLLRPGSRTCMDTI